MDEFNDFRFYTAFGAWCLIVLAGFAVWLVTL
jgi:hypothetical protein